MVDSIDSVIASGALPGQPIEQNALSPATGGETRESKREDRETPEEQVEQPSNSMIGIIFGAVIVLGFAGALVIYMRRAL